MNGTRPDRLGVELVVADRLEVFLRDDLATVEGEAGGEERIGLLGVEHNGERVGRLDRSTVVKTVATVFALGSYVRSMENFTSAALRGSPLWNLTPRRSLNVQVVGWWPSTR